MRRVIGWLLVLLVLLPGCSATQQIASNATQIADLAHAEKASAISRMPQDPEGSSATIGRMESVIDLSNEIASLVTQTRDNGFIDRLGGLLSQWAWTLGVLGIVVLAILFLFFTPFGKALRVSMGFIPSSLRSDVELTLDAEAGGDQRVRELVAAKRQDPAWNSAYRKSRNKRRQERKGT